MTDEIPDEIVEVATMALLGHEKRGDLAPGVDWKVRRDWTINIARDQMRKALTAALDHHWKERQMKSDAEIERLRAEKQDIAMQALASMGQATDAYGAQLKTEAEMERLRAALTEIATTPGLGRSMASRSIAHKALDTDTGEDG